MRNTLPRQFFHDPRRSEPDPAKIGDESTRYRIPEDEGLVGPSFDLPARSWLELAAAILLELLCG